MASSSAPSGGNSSNGGQSSSQSYPGKREGSSKQKFVSVRIQPTIGPSFALSLSTSTKISTLKETISDKMGLSPQKMTLLLHNIALDTGTLAENGIDDGSEVRLVPAIESGVTTANSVDPVAMMKHSMSGISDQQIDDFLNGKFPLSVAIRVGESVVVVNLHRAKVEEIEMEPPPHKKRRVGSRQLSHHDDVDYLDSTLATKHSSRDNYQYLNSNHSASDLIGSRNFSPPCMSTHHHHHHRSSRRKGHHTHSKNQGMLESRHRRTLNPSPSGPYPPDRSMLTYTRDIPGAPMETAVAISAPPPMDGHGHNPIPRATPIISKDAPVHAPIPAAPCQEAETDAKETFAEKLDSGEESMDVTTTEIPKLTGNPPLTESTVTSCANTSLPPTAVVPGNADVAVPGACCSGDCKHKSVSRSVQTDPEPLGPREKRETTRNISRKDSKASSGREVKLPESGISMKRKAVMEAISEILKKMYANTEKGRLPGSFKGRFSSEFTCDSDMREILHSKTTMTSYGSEGGEASNKAGTSDAGGADLLRGNASHLSKARLEEHQQIKDKVADLKWRMQHKRALKMAKRKGERSPCGWMEALNCDMPRGEPKATARSGYCGLKRGFLLAD